MYTKAALRALGIDAPAFTAEQRRALEVDGSYIVEDVITPAECRTMAEAFEALHAAESERGGHEVHVEPGARRVSNIFNKTNAFDRCLELANVLAAAHWLLGEIKLHGANLRDPVKGYGHQQLHVDVPKKFADDWWVLNAMILFDDMTLENGPTRVVPGSHHWAPINVPVVNQGDWEPTPLSPEDAARVPEDLDAPYPGEILVTAPARSAVVLNSSLWHSGTLKKDDSHRRAPASHLHAARPAAAAGPTRPPDRGALSADEPGPTLSDGDRAAPRRQRPAPQPQARPRGLVELNVRWVQVVGGCCTERQCLLNRPELAMVRPARIAHRATRGATVSGAGYVRQRRAIRKRSIRECVADQLGRKVRAMEGNQ